MKIYREIKEILIIRNRIESFETEAMHYSGLYKNIKATSFSEYTQMSKYLLNFVL